MKFPIPESVLHQHTAILGKTGSGKTSTSKLIIEHVVAEDFRVCVLDPIKSDWWGITSSSDGHKPGLDFKILGGPRGHVPLHANAGKVIGQLVGDGKLRHSIIDMADFEAGGIQKFFVDFAPSLMRHMKGVVYLVIEEAHEMAPKERAGFGAENLAIHWAKKLATAGRSKGIRLIVATQRVQSLHNAVLGSCETIIAHRLTTPADQKPVVDWLRANTSKETADQVSSSLSSQPTGTAWVCSGESKLFENVTFPRFSTYDNTATPTGDSEAREIKTTPVDHEELKAIIGEAVAEAIANDPVTLKNKIAALERDLRAVRDPTPVDNHALVALGVVQKKSVMATSRISSVMEQMESVKSELIEISKYPITRNGIQSPNHASGASPLPTRIQFRHNNPPVNGDTKLGLKDRKFLAVLSQFQDGLQAGKLMLLSGYKWNGDTRNALSRLRTGGYMVGGNQETMCITESGLEQGPFPDLPQGRELINYWLNHPEFGLKDRKFLECLVLSQDGMDRESLCRDSGYEWNGDTRNALSRLRTAGVIEGKNGGVMKLSSHLIELL